MSEEPRSNWPSRTVTELRPAVVGIPASEQHNGSPVEVFQDEAYDTLDLEHLDVHPYGYRW
ncbi:hypothetical protein GCM10009744_58710 [Kribbella alba]|uniref:Uncharacterized protein n=1 Tax=Kribbella alba TaxID=190197 RepID=A0ABP4RQF7_9ACTN